MFTYRLDQRVFVGVFPPPGRLVQPVSQNTAHLASYQPTARLVIALTHHGHVQVLHLEPGSIFKRIQSALGKFGKLFVNCVEHSGVNIGEFERIRPLLVKILK